MQTRNAVLRACSVLAFAFQREIGASVKEADLYKVDVSSELNRLVITMGGRWMLQGREFGSSGYVVCVYVLIC